MSYVRISGKDIRTDPYKYQLPIRYMVVIRRSKDSPNSPKPLMLKILTA